ncbi:MAG: cytochrome c oxidase subunit II [Pseudomonadota bacterium]
MRSTISAFLSAAAATALAGTAHAAQPVDGGFGLQPAATRIMERVDGFHDFLLVIITSITVFVLALLLWVMWRYNKRAHPTPKKFSHNTTVEVIWTLVPVLILVAIASPSFQNLYYQDAEPDLPAIAESGDFDNPNVFPDAAAKGWITVKAQGNQWNWTYQYPDVLDDSGFPLEFTSNPVHKGRSDDQQAYENLTGRGDFDAKLRNLAVDYPMVVPVNRYIRYQTTASDVIHSWTVPAFGVKTDSVPGKLNEGWFLIREPGVYYGQCSELCGVNHAYMPIEVRAVSEAQYAEWTAAMLEGQYEDAVQIVRMTDPGAAETELAALRQ